MASSEWLVCPSCGHRISAERSDHGLREPALLSLDSTSSESIPAGAFSSSSEFRPSSGGPDPFLEHLARGELEGTHPAEPEGHNSPLGLIPPDTRPPSFDGLDLGKLGLSPSAISDQGRSAAGRTRPSRDDDAETGDPPRSNLPVVLLASYASALTLAMLWLVVLPRIRGGTGGPVVAQAPPDARADPGSRAEKSRRVEPLAPIPQIFQTSVGRPLTVGSVEVTPLGVEWSEISLRRARLSGSVVRRDEERMSLVLRLRLRNVSRDEVFAPFDEGFVRERDMGAIDSFVELSNGGRIYPFPLALESDWSIEGQRFEETKPGQSFDTILVVTPEGDEQIRSPLLWRLRLRTGIDQTDVVGVTTDAPDR